MQIPAFLGNGGFAGSIQESPSLGVPFGFATAATDTGNQGVELDGSWALNNPAKQLDYGSRGVHVTAQADSADPVFLLCSAGSPLFLRML